MHTNVVTFSLSAQQEDLESRPINEKCIDQNTPYFVYFVLSTIHAAVAA